MSTSDDHGHRSCVAHDRLGLVAVQAHTTAVDELWSGVLGALIGAIAGGAFTTVGAVLQVRGALKAAYVQAELAARTAEDLHTRERFANGLRRAIGSSHRFYNALEAEFFRHAQHGESIKCASALEGEDFELAYREFMTFYFTNLKTLPNGVLEEMSRVQLYVDTIRNKTVTTLESFREERPSFCLYGSALDLACETLDSIELEMGSMLATAMGLEGGLPAVRARQR